MKRNAWLAAIALGTLPLAAQDSKDRTLSIPLKGLTAACCESPVEKAIGKIDNVESAKIRKDGSAYFVDVVLKPGFGMAVSAIDKALGVANRDMGDQMGTKYEIDGSLSLALVHMFKTKSEPDEAKLKEALAKLDNFKSVRVCKDGFSVVFQGKTLPTLADVKKASALEIVDLILAPSKECARYSCPMDPEQVSSVPADCPKCGMKMTKVDASSAACESKPTEPQKKSDDSDDC